MFKLNIGTQTATISEYDKRIRILVEQRVNVSNAIRELFGNKSITYKLI